MRALLALVVAVAVVAAMLRVAGWAAPDAPAAQPAPTGVPAAAQLAVVASITDGDTLRVGVDGRNEPVRLLEVDTPEVGDACGANEATAALATLAPVGATVWLEADVEERDRYARLLRYVWLADGTMVNRTLVRRGWARPVLYPPNDRHWDAIRRAGARARRRGAGLWRRCGWTEVIGFPGAVAVPADLLASGDVRPCSRAPSCARSTPPRPP